MKESARIQTAIELTDEDLREIDRAVPPPTRKIRLAGW